MISPMPSYFKKLVVLTLALTLILVMMGAWVRLTDAGLGCPDWPGCYGKLTPTMAKDEISKAVQVQGGEHGPVSMGKAWREMLHRYLASFVGLLILIMAGIALAQKKPVNTKSVTAPWKLPLGLLAVVIMQGLFGMWTVTLDLRPIIVTTHLMGGMLTFAMLTWLFCRQQAVPKAIDFEPLARLRPMALIAMAVLVGQIFLGGWTSTNYAALACSDLPLCHGKLIPDVNFSQGFTLFRELGVDPAGNPITLPALTAIHLTHRLGAIVAFVVIGLLVGRVIAAGQSWLGRAIGVALLVQVALGLSNVWFSLPLPVATLHNGGAAVLLGLLVILNYRVYHAQLRV
jgi:heme a synthase